MKRVTAIMLSLALSLSLLCPAWAAAASPVLKIQNGALTLEGLGDQSINSVQLELTMSGTGTPRFSAANSTKSSYGVGKTDGAKLTIYVDSLQSLNQGGAAFLGMLYLDGNEVISAKLTLLGRDLDPNAILDESSPIQIQRISGSAPGGNPSGGGSGSDPDAASTGTPTPKPGSGASAGSSAAPGSAISFTDVPANAYYADAVAWALDNSITTGTGDGTTFEPNGTCTRAQIVTFLWRAAGSPRSSGVNPFTDIDSGAYYYNAVLWAVTNGITTGTGDGTTFEPNGTCTRAQAVSFLYRAKGSPAVSGTNSFTDVPANSYYTNAVQWAVTNNITTGTGDGTTFEPQGLCTRAHIVTFLYRDRVD